MYGLPRQQQLQPDEHGLLFMPPEGLSGNDESESRGLELPDRVRSVPQHQHMAECDVQSQQHWIHSDRITHGTAAAVHRLPRQQQLQPDQHGVLLMPLEGLYERVNAGESHCREFPDYV